MWIMAIKNISNFEEHMEECSPCRTYLEQLRITREALRLLPSEGGENPRRGELVDEFIREFERGRK